MRKYPVTFLAIITAATVVICYLFLQLRAERIAAAQLRDGSREAIQAGGSAAAAPRPDNQSSPSASTDQDARPTAPTRDAVHSAASPPKLYRSMIPKALGLTTEEKDAFIRLHESGGSYWDFVALIGAKYEQYLEFQRSTAREVRVRQLRSSLEVTDYPLTDVQAAQLDSLLDADLLRRAADDKNRVRPSDPRALLDYDEATLLAKQAGVDRVVAEARGFLRPEQTVVLQGQLHGPLSRQLANLRTRRAQLDAGGQ